MRSGDLETTLRRDAESALDVLVEQLLERCESPIERIFVLALIADGWTPYERESGVVLLRRRFSTTLQKDVPPYRLDFAIESKERRVDVELDGHDFHDRTKEQASRDRERDRALGAAGWTVLRFTGSDVARGPDRVVGEVADRLGLPGRAWAPRKGAANDGDALERELVAVFKAAEARQRRAGGGGR